MDREALAVAKKSPPGLAHGELPPNRVSQVACPANPGLPPISLPFPSPQLASMRFRSKTEATPPLGTCTTLSESVTELMIALAGRFPATSNSNNARVRPPL